MDQCETFLKKTECPFNWHLSKLDVNHSQPMLEQIKWRLDQKHLTADASSENKWPLQLTYGFELFAEDPTGALKCVDETIGEVTTSEETLNVKYREPYLHIARSTKAFMMLKTGSRVGDVELLQLVRLIKPKTNMSNVEMAALLAMKAQMIRYYGPAGTTQGLPLLREAIRRNPNEVEWKISLVISLNRKRHVHKSFSMEWDEVEEPVNILEELLNRSDLTEKQTVQCKYFLAVAYYDYSLGKPHYAADSKSCRKEILRLCEEIHDKTDFPPFLSFCAEQFAVSDKRRGWKIIENLLNKFPTSVSLNITACKFLKRQGDLSTAAKHAQIALDHGCYGGAWLWLQCKTKMKEAFDEEEFFQKIHSSFQKMYHKETYFKASMYYFFVKKDPVNGAHNMEAAIVEDPEFATLHKPFTDWYTLHSKVASSAIEVAYNQVVLALRSNWPRSDYCTLDSAKRKIEEVTNVDEFETVRNLVEEALRGERPKPTANAGTRQRPSQDIRSCSKRTQR